MTERERVKLALTHHGTDIVPYNVELTSQSMARFCAYTGQSDPPENIASMIRAMRDQ